MVESTSCAASTSAEPLGRGVWVACAVVCLLLGYWLTWGFASAPPNVSAELTWQEDLHAAIELARAQDKPLHVHLAQASAPLAARMQETLGAAPVAQVARLGFVNVRLDAGVHADEFRRWLGGAGALGSCLLDVSQPGEPDVLAVLPGFAEPDRYLEFLDASRKSLGELRELRQKAEVSATARLALGQLYAAQGSEARARSTLLRVQEPRALHAQALEQLARLDIAGGQLTRARAEHERARASSDATNAASWALTEASLLAAERRVSQAAELLESALPKLESPRERASGLLLLGSLQHELHDDAAALSIFARLKLESQGTAMAREAAERIRHIEQPEPGHAH